VDIDGRGGRFSFVLPYATLEPVRDKLVQRFMGETLGQESIWPSHMREQMLATPVDIEVILGCTDLTLNKVQSLEVGQTVPFLTQPDQPMILQCGGIELGLAHAGQRRRHVAVSLVSEIGKGRRT
jgi:flagellar motor switch protein FliM